MAQELVASYNRHDILVRTGWYQGNIYGAGINWGEANDHEEPAAAGKIQILVLTRLNILSC
jgi:hypothetical protein